MIRKCASPIPNHLRVIFELPASLWCERISLVADFNNWDPLRSPLRQERDGVWRVVVDLPICQRFEFGYLVDDVWASDSHADGVAPNGYGSFNSLLDTAPIAVFPVRSLGHGMVHEGGAPH
jgi:hypothetical protein